jgi:hypothetical protein
MKKNGEVLKFIIIFATEFELDLFLRTLNFFDCLI